MEIRFVQENNTFKMKITLDRHRHRLQENPAIAIYPTHINSRYYLPLKVRYFSQESHGPHGHNNNLHLS
jgi:hypothetical protein